jgi:hypothetical protein
MGDIIKPVHFIGPAKEIGALASEILTQPNLNHVAAEAASAHKAVLTARDALEALVDLLNGQ